MYKTISNAIIRKFHPCYDPSDVIKDENEELPIKDWIQKYRDVVPVKDIVWLLCRREFLYEKDLRLFVVWCASESLKLIEDPDKRSVEACNVVERYANRETTKDELDAAYIAADNVADAAHDAAYAAALAAARDAYYAADYIAYYAALSVANAVSAARAAANAARVAYYAALSVANAVSAANAARVAYYAALAAANAARVAYYAAYDDANAAANAARIAQVDKLLTYF